MKKFLFGFLALALIASNAFADLTFGGALGGGVQVISVQVEDGDQGKPQTNWVDGYKPGWWSAFQHFGRLHATYTNDDGSFGAFARFTAAGDSSRYWAWWKPLDVLQLSIGREGNGVFGNQYIVGWGFHGNDAEDYVALNGYGFTRNAAWYSGFDDFRAWISLTPVEGLAINIGVPYNGDLAEDVYKNTDAQIAYNISGIGEFAVTYIGATGKLTYKQPAQGEWVLEPGSEDGSGNGPKYTWKTNTDTSLPGWASVADAGAVQAQFYLTAVEGLGVNLGFKYTFAVEENKIKVETPMAIGLGLSYAISDTMGIKARFATTLAGQFSQADTVVYKEGLKIGFDLEPYFDLGMMKLFVNLGFEYEADNEIMGSSGKLESTKHPNPLSWYVNPYIVKSVGGASFYAGLQFGGRPTDADNKDHIFFALPIGLQVAF